jgi:hypothetical protein
MKNIYCLLFIFVLFASGMKAQKAEVGITFSALSDNSIARFNGDYISDSGTDAGKSHTFGITYIKPLNKWLSIESGIEFLQGKASIHSIVSTMYGLSTVSHSGTMSLINIPVSLRASFWKYCFVNGGLFIDMDVSADSPINSQSGIGSQLGFGLKYNFKTGISVFVNPYTKIHAFPISFQSNQEHLFESAIRFGMSYQL